jgi:hypothetical protein
MTHFFIIHIAMYSRNARYTYTIAADVATANTKQYRSRMENGNKANNAKGKKERSTQVIFCSMKRSL